MTMGGSGLCVLLAPIKGVDYRLAYLQVLYDKPSLPAGCDGELKLEFYQLNNVPLWVGMLRDYPDLFSALQPAGRAEEIKLIKRIKSPSGRIRVREYNLAVADWEAEPDSGFTQGEVVLPKRFTISNITSHLLPDMEESSS